MQQHKGFTLIELMVVIALVGIITSIAWSSYEEQVRTGKRAEAVTATTAVALALTQFESDNGTFAWNSPPGAVTVANAHNRFKPLADVGTDSSDPAQNNNCAQTRGFRYKSTGTTRYESCRGNYFITVDLTDATGFLITTTPVAGTDQTNDTDCLAFTLNNAGTKNITGTSSVRRCWGSN